MATKSPISSSSSPRPASRRQCAIEAVRRGGDNWKFLTEAVLTTPQSPNRHTAYENQQQLVPSPTSSSELPALIRGVISPSLANLIAGEAGTTSPSSTSLPSRGTPGTGVDLVLPTPPAMPLSPPATRTNVMGGPLPSPSACIPHTPNLELRRYHLTSAEAAKQHRIPRLSSRPKCAPPVSRDGTTEQFFRTVRSRGQQAQAEGESGSFPASDQEPLAGSLSTTLPHMEEGEDLFPPAPAYASSLEENKLFAETPPTRGVRHPTQQGTPLHIDVAEERGEQKPVDSDTDAALTVLSTAEYDQEEGDHEQQKGEESTTEKKKGVKFAPTRKREGQRESQEEEGETPPTKEVPKPVPSLALQAKHQLSLGAAGASLPLAGQFVPRSPRVVFEKDLLQSSSSDTHGPSSRRRDLTPSTSLQLPLDEEADENPMEHFKVLVREIQRDFGYNDPEEVRHIDRVIAELDHWDLALYYSHNHPLPRLDDATIRAEPSKMIPPTWAKDLSKERAKLHARLFPSYLASPSSGRRKGVTETAAGANTARSAKDDIRRLMKNRTSTTTTVGTPRQRARQLLSGTGENRLSSPSSCDEEDAFLGREEELMKDDVSTTQTVASSQQAQRSTPSSGTPRQQKATSIGGVSSELSFSPRTGPTMYTLPGVVVPPPAATRFGTDDKLQHPSAIDRQGAVGLPKGTQHRVPVKPTDNPFHERYLRLDKIQMTDQQERLVARTSESLDHLRTIGLLK